MTKYIDVEKLIAEIERRYHKAVDESKYINSAKFVRNELENLREFAYSLQQEQPEVDFEKEIKNERTTLLDAFGPMNGEQSLAIRNFALHFYELGLKARKK